MMKSRLLILMIMTWCLLSMIVQGQSTSPQIASPAGSLTIEAWLTYQSGEVLVLTLQKLYLLDKHPGKILREAQIPLEKERESKGDDGYVEQLKARLAGPRVETNDQKAAQEIAQIFTALAAQAKRTATLDFNGK